MPTQAVRRSQFSREYHSALQAYLNNDPRGDLEPARELGRQAVLLGFDTLELARIHEIAMSALVSSEMSSGPGPTDEARPVEPQLSQVNHRETLLARSGVFFAEALTPIEQTHRGALEANMQLNQIIKALSHRTVELADSNEELRLEILLRKSTEAHCEPVTRRQVCCWKIHREHRRNSAYCPGNCCRFRRRSGVGSAANCMT